MQNDHQTRALQDCFITVDGAVLTIGNRCISRRFDMHNAALLDLTDRLTNKIYPGETPIQNPVIDLHTAKAVLSCYVEDHYGASEPFLTACVEYTQGTTSLAIRFSVFPGLPFVQSRMVLTSGGGSFEPMIQKAEMRNETDFDRSQILDAVTFEGRHRKMTAYSLYDYSDFRSQPVRCSTYSLYHTGKNDEFGSVFHVQNMLDNEELLLVKNAPVCQSHLAHITPDLHLDGKYLYLCGAGVDYRSLPVGELELYGATVGVGKDLLRAHRDLLRAMNRGKGTLFSMENTWGDRNLDAKLCDAFVQKEIDTAAEIGIDFVQIDDGWSKGTVDTQDGFISHVWEGYYTNDPDYWTVSKKKFPNGLKPICDYGREKGVEVGLWFSPDSEDEFAHWMDDTDTLYRFYTDCGIRYFKLDGIHMDTKPAEKRLNAMLKELTRRSGNDIMFQMDVTAGKRFGFVYHREHGTLFVENRYTDFASYYPHTSLRNLWLLSKLIPTRQVQFEFLNNRRNRDKYGDDPLAPGYYKMDYLFATTMVSNPLVWMELSELDRADIPVLRRVVSVWKKHRDALYQADVTPIGEEPNGFRFTGFYADCGEAGGYALLFRELTEEDSFTFQIPALMGKQFSIDVLDASGNSKLETTECGIRAVLSENRSYVFARILPER